jgi:hypothetical protein
MSQTVPHLKFNVGDGATARAGAKLYEFAPHTARKDQRLLLAIAFLLLFVSLGSLAVSGSEIKAPGM